MFSALSAFQKAAAVNARQETFQDTPTTAPVLNIRGGLSTEISALRLEYRDLLSFQDLPS